MEGGTETDKKRLRDAAEESVDSPDVKRLRENLLNGLDDDAEICTSSVDLESFMRSFQEEIAPLTSVVGGASEEEAVVPESESGEPRPDLGYLLEASDDELGIPPPPASCSGVNDGDLRTELVRVECDSSVFGAEFWEFPDHDTFGFELGEAAEYGDYVMLGYLLERSDPVIGSGDLPFRPETLPAQ